jgi:predicted MPP superfamily phosphohydrolase
MTLSAASLPLAVVVAMARGLSALPPFYAAVYAASLLVAAYGVLVRRRWVLVQRCEVPIRGLPPSFDGYRIAQLSDLHIGALTPKSWGLAWARLANAARPDLAVVTGDMVTSGTDFHGDVADVVGSLEAKDGVVVSMGNHDYFGEGEPLISMLRSRGVEVLRNEGRLLERGSARLFLAGIDDTWTRRADLARALRAQPPDARVVLLAHDPDAFRAAAERGVSLVLSGHTHGGQVAMPFLARRLNLSKLVHEFTLGLYRVGDSTLFVHPGLGTTGPPVRFGVPPAVVVLTLRAC